MLRLYMPNGARLHVWSDRHVTPDVSLIHTHPWGFKSTVIAGSLKNVRFNRIPGDTCPGFDALDVFYEQKIKCGEGGGLRDKPTLVQLGRDYIEMYAEGESYEQTSDEIHMSIPLDGTVTVINRTFNDDVDHASVFWRVFSEFVSAEPKVATKKQVVDITRNSLDKWFNRK